MIIWIFFLQMINVRIHFFFIILNVFFYSDTYHYKHLFYIILRFFINDLIYVRI